MKLFHNKIKTVLCFIFLRHSNNCLGGAVAWWFTPQTPDPEVRGSSPTRVAVLCP